MSEHVADITEKTIALGGRPASEHNVLPDIKKLSDAISEPIRKLFIVGDYLLVLLFIGSLLEVLAALLSAVSPYDSVAKWWLLALGGVLLLGIFVTVLYTRLKVHSTERRLIRDNADLMNTFQAVALQLAQCTNDLQSLLFKHSAYVAEVLEYAAPLLAQIAKVQPTVFSSAQDINRFIVQSAEDSRTVIQDVEKAIKDCDPAHLKKHAEQLKSIGKALKEALTADGNSIGFGQLHVIQTSLQEALGTYLNEIDKMSTEALVWCEKGNALWQSIQKLGVARRMLDSVGAQGIYDQARLLESIVKKVQEHTRIIRRAIVDGDAAALHRLKVASVPGPV